MTNAMRSKGKRIDMLKMSSRHLLCMLTAAFACHVFASRVVALPALPQGELPNSEIVTNIALGASLERLDWISFFNQAALGCGRMTIK